MKDFIIRNANSNDYINLFALIKEFALFQKTPGKVSITVAQMKEDEHLFHCLIAETNESEMIGFATYFPVYFSWSGKAMYVDDLFVKAAYRNRGIGKQLLFSVIDLAKDNGYKKVRWQVSDWNTNAIEFYKSLGVAINDTERNCDLIL